MLDLEMRLDDGAAGMTVGVLAVEKIGGTDCGGLKREKQVIEESLREKYGSLTRAELKLLHPIDIYIAYYKKFGYMYHVLPQLESTVQGKDIPDVLPPVTAMYMAELKNMMLTAGHDLDKVVMPLRLKRSSGNELTPTLSGKEVMTVQRDYMITDREGVISAILRGCDGRTAITEKTINVIYGVYAPAGIDRELVWRHLDDIETYIQLFSKAPQTLLKEIYDA